MNPLDFHKLASSLIAQNGAAEFRTAISRAYYGAFLFCCKKINGIGFNLPSDYTAHEQVKRYLNNCGDFQLQKVASQLLGLRQTRNKADYDLKCKSVEIEKNANFTVKQAKRMIQIIDDRFSSNGREIAVNIEKYRTEVLKS